VFVVPYRCSDSSSTSAAAPGGGVAFVRDSTTCQWDFPPCRDFLSTPPFGSNAAGCAAIGAGSASTARRDDVSSMSLGLGRQFVRTAEGHPACLVATARHISACPQLSFSAIHRRPAPSNRPRPST